MALPVLACIVGALVLATAFVLILAAIPEKPKLRFLISLYAGGGEKPITEIATSFYTHGGAIIFRREGDHIDSLFAGTFVCEPLEENQPIPEMAAKPATRLVKLFHNNCVVREFAVSSYQLSIDGTFALEQRGSNIPVVLAGPTLIEAIGSTQLANQV